MKINIIPASRDDASFLAKAVLTAIGDEHVLQMAGSADRIPLIKELFTSLASMENSQYSYRNALIAVNDDGKRIGAVIFYDGAMLHQLRLAFIAESSQLLGWTLSQDDFADETSPDEVYLDSLMVLPEYRGQGVGSILISEVYKRAVDAGKPVGLLVDYENTSARKLYISLGFRNAGNRFFAGKEMEHLLKTS